MASKLSVSKSDDYENSNIRWSNVIFLPFHPVFKVIVLVAVLFKTTLGPMQSVYPFIICSNMMDHDIYLSYAKYFYMYIVDLIYGADTFLHIVHRQVTDLAMRREHLPKSGLLLILDVLSLIPFFKLLANEICPPAQFWPNVLAFNEVLIMYRVVEYFSLIVTHSVWKITIGFILMTLLVLNCLACFLLILTIYGFCPNCTEGVYDWRSFIVHRFETKGHELTTYIYAVAFVLSFLVRKLGDEIKPCSYLEFPLVVILMILGYIVLIFVIMPKAFSEGHLRLRRICSFHPHVKRIIEETKRRNPSRKAHVHVEKFYSLIWQKRSGITSMPNIIIEFPRYLRLDIMQGLVWPVFYHSPTFRNTSSAYKRWLCEHIVLDYKLPGERFYVGPHCFSNLFYLKSGIVQLMSADDSTSPMLSVSGGTIFGDISFHLPPLKRNLIVRCLTYCEVFTISRAHVLMSLYRFPEDRRHIMTLTKERIKHARTLYTCKQHVRGLDRSEDEGVAWLKRRWWEISDALSKWKKTSKKDVTKCQLPAEEAVYHCSKYIGQIVLSTDVQLQRKSMFSSVKFPWILAPNSGFGLFWHRVIISTIYLVLILYPPNITRLEIPSWFIFFQFYADLTYILDVLISLMTSIETQENLMTNFAEVMFARFKNRYFLLDLLSTPWMENIIIIIGMPEYYQLCKFNRLIKTYKLFVMDRTWQANKNPITRVFFSVSLTIFCYVYIFGYLLYLIERFIPELTAEYFFGDNFCANSRNASVECNSSIISIVINLTFEFIFAETVPKYLVDIFLGMLISVINFIVYVYIRSRFTAALYLKYREITNYVYFVHNLNNYYLNHKIHPDLLKRLNRYMVCHWKYYNGIDVMFPNPWKNEPYDIYWKLQGEIAEKTIGESRAFQGADPALIRELAHKTSFLILPRNSTLFLFGVECKNVTWVIHGDIKCEYHNKKGDLLKFFHEPGEMLCLSAVFLGQSSLRTYAAATECEGDPISLPVSVVAVLHAINIRQILYIKIKDFFTIIKRYPDEWAYFENCVEEFGPEFDEMFHAYVKTHREYQKHLRNIVFHGKQSAISHSTMAMKREHQKSTLRIHKPRFGLFKRLKIWLHPDTIFIQYWILIRAIFAVISIVSASLQGGSGALYRNVLITIDSICDMVTLADILIKTYMPYYDERGLLISDTNQCTIHYVTRTLLIDMVGVIPWHMVFDFTLSYKTDQNTAVLLKTLSKFAHIYNVLGYFNYRADIPTANIAIITIVKWQIVSILVMLGACHYYMYKCIIFNWDDNLNLINLTLTDICWNPFCIPLDKTPTYDQLHMLYANSINLAQCGLIRVNIGKFHMDRNKLGMAASFVVLGLIFWYFMCYSQTLLVLTYRGNTLFQNGVNQLVAFLKSERVDNEIIDRAVSYYSYWWIRTKGLNLQHLINERLGVVFRQDLSHYFYKKTFSALNTILRGGEAFERNLANIITQVYFLRGQEIVREMDLNPYLYIVHRGKVVVSRDGQILAVLTKGAIFGQLDDLEPRPIRITATAEEHTDLLQLQIKQFQEVISDDVRLHIDGNPQSAYDFLALKKIVPENPYNTVRYILRGRKVIKLPYTKAPIEAHHHNWYSRWLILIWFVVPVLTAVFVLILNTLPDSYKYDVMWILIVLDLFHLAHFVSEFFTMKLVVEHEDLIYQYDRWRLLTRWGFYCDVLSLIIPLATLATQNWLYQLARLLRLYLFYNFHRQFCENFQTKFMPILMKFVLVLLLLHGLTCGWMTIACRNEGEFPVPTPTLPPDINTTIDYDQWVLPENRRGGCARLTKSFMHKDKSNVAFIVPKDWRADYLVALTYIVIIHAQINMDTVLPLTISQIYFKIIVTITLLLVDLWITSVTISTVYAKFRNMYQYDYHVSKLTSYLKHNGLSTTLLDKAIKYSHLLWQRQRGCWLPEITHQAPLCIREDILGALYMHHLRTPPLFQTLPFYFLRQLVARLRRVVIFPGKNIVVEGDLFPFIYFIHEGEVEKWYTDSSGESKMASLLTTNGYFGLIPGLFPTTPYQFTYHTRTVVDLVYLKFSDWQDLLTGYPIIKTELYENAKKLRKKIVTGP